MIEITDDKNMVKQRSVHEPQMMNRPSATWNLCFIQ